jgi:hypothetical protein
VCKNKPCNVLFIIISSVLVLDNGLVKEFGNPQMLMRDADSQFHDMCKEAGLLSDDDHS